MLLFRLVVEEAQAQAPQIPEASSSDPRIDQLVDAVQLITTRLENLNGTVSPTRRVEDDPSDETMSERKIVDSRALFHLTRADTFRCRRFQNLEESFRCAAWQA